MKLSTKCKLTRRLGMDHLARLYYAGKTPILMYHGVMPDKFVELSCNYMHTSVSLFEKQMQFIKKHFNPVGIHELYNKSIANKIVVTFDDGFANNFKYAFPILQKYKIPAAIFLVTEFLDNSSSVQDIFWFEKLQTLSEKIGCDEISTLIENIKLNYHPHEMSDAANKAYSELSGLHQVPSDLYESYRVLQPNELKIMSDSGLITFGSHTHQHELLSKLTANEIRYTLGRSLDIIKNLGINYVPAICYPNGYYNTQVVDIAKKLGYTMGVTAKQGFFDSSVDRFEIRRLGVLENVTGQDDVFQSMVSGVLDLFIHFKGGYNAEDDLAYMGTAAKKLGDCSGS